LKEQPFRAHAIISTPVFDDSAGATDEQKTQALNPSEPIALNAAPKQQYRTDRDSDKNW
jgi:hypothetical protein